MDTETLRLHSLLSATRRRWDRALELVAQHLERSPRSYVSWSGGKDSTAVAVLATTVNPDVPLVRFSRGVDFPEVVDYCATLAAERGWNYRVAAEPLPPDVSIEHDRHRSRREAEIVWMTLCATLGHEPTGWLYGLRRDESDDRRKLLIRTRGAWTSKEGLHVAAPVWDWTLLDVHAWLHHNHIPLCGIYARLTELGAPLGAQRVGYLIGPGGHRTGRYMWLRRGWPHLWAELQHRYPHLHEADR